jgi:hypothetical protein
MREMKFFITVLIVGATSSLAWILLTEEARDRIELGEANLLLVT